MSSDHPLHERRNHSPATYICCATFFVLGGALEYAMSHLASLPVDPEQGIHAIHDNVDVAAALLLPFTFPICYALATVGRALLLRAPEAHNPAAYRVLRVGLFLLKCSIFGYLGAMLVAIVVDGQRVLVPLMGILASAAIVFAFSHHAPAVNREIVTRTPRALLISFVLLLIAAGNAAAWATSLRIGFLSPSVASAIQLLTTLTCVTILLVLFSIRLAGSVDHPAPIDQGTETTTRQTDT